MKNILKTILGACVLMCAAGCVESNDTPDPTPEEKTNYITWNGETSPIVSTLYEFKANRLCVYVSSEEISSIEELDNHDHCTVALIPILLGEEFDIMKEKSTFAVAHYDVVEQDFDLYAAPGDNEGISSGRCRVELNEESGYLVVDYTLQGENGESLAVYDSLACSLILPDVASNYIMCYDAKKPINAAFYDDRAEGALGIWLTPGDIDWFEVGHIGYSDINDVVSCLCIYVPSDNLPESLQDIQSTDREFSIVYTNLEKDLNNPLVIQVSSEVKNGAEGYYSVSRAEGENSYNVILDLYFKGEHIAANFTGQCKSVEDKPEILYSNSVTYGDESFSIGSIIVDRRAEQTTGLVDVWMSATLGIKDLDTIKESSPVSLVGYPIDWIGDSEKEYYAGFSANESLAISYDGKTWSKATGSRGTAMLKDFGNDQYYVRFMNNPDISFEWMGKVIVLR